MYYPGTDKLCRVGERDPALRYAGSLKFGITETGDAGSVTGPLTFTPGGYNTVFDSIYLTAGDHYVVLYDNAQSGNVCNAGGSLANKWVIADDVYLDWLGP